MAGNYTNSVPLAGLYYSTNTKMLEAINDNDDENPKMVSSCAQFNHSFI